MLGGSAPTGVWIIGSRGSVAATAITGAAAVTAGLATNTGLVTMRPPFTDAGLPALGDLVFGGHDLVETPLAVRAARLVDGGVLPDRLPEAVATQLAAAESEMRPGITFRDARSEPLAAVARIGEDLADFRARHQLERVVVINLCSTEPPAEPHPAHAEPEALMGALRRGLGILPPSSLYALAAIEQHCAFIDFTPSAGARIPALELLAERAGVPLGGSDGKTGETLLKSALAPMFASRSLRVRSWAGANLLGGGDGEALADPVRAQSKLNSKARSVEEILGYPVEQTVRIDNIKDLGEWKTAWDHISFEGFLGVRMKLQFTWEGCDSALAAPLVLDLARLGALALERGTARRGPGARVLLQGPRGDRRARAGAPVRGPHGVGGAGGHRVRAPAPGAVAELVRLPAVLSVPGDVLLGAAASGQGRDVPRAAGLAAASSCLYLAGMALNDYADREVDAVERPGRPIPSGRVTPGFALGLAGGLTAAAAGIAVAADGTRALQVLAPLAASVWAYDLLLKQTPAGPVSMAACRGLDVLMGSGAHGAVRALPQAAVVTAHIGVTTTVSQREVEGATPRLPRLAAAATVVVAAAAGAVAASSSRSAARLAAAAGLVGAYAATVGGAHARAIQDPSPTRLQQAVGASVLGLMPLEAGMLATSGGLAPAGGVAALWPVARTMARARKVT